jgi:flavoprotein hydroxylase
MRAGVTERADVLIVGFGPVGQTLAMLLARRGRRVTVVERWPEPYVLPRATVFDGETARTLAGLGLGDELAGVGTPTDSYDWRNAAGETLIRLEFSRAGAHGWPDATTFHQPALEELLTRHAARLPSLRVLRGHTVTGLTDDGDEVTVVVRTASGPETSLRASWVIGCDGANSFVREAIGATTTDLGFSHDWLLCDVVPRDPAAFDRPNLQICDPARPTTAVGSGPGHRRWEFMRRPDEPLSDLDRPETAWRLLAGVGVTPETAALERHTVYTFRAAWADTWRRGRVLLAGDAAHVMPPFAGQGMCSGIRDAANLAWKLDLVIAGRSGERLLDTYEEERLTHVRETVELSVRLGRVICVTDADEAQRRDTALASGGSPGRPVAQTLRTGFLHRSLGTVAAPPTGALMPQARVARDGRTGLFDDVAGTGFAFLATTPPDAVLGPGDREQFAELGVTAVHIVPPGTPPAAGAAVDLDDVYLPFLAANRAKYVIVRPDHHIFGVARNNRELTAVLAQFREQLADAEALHSSRH